MSNRHQVIFINGPRRSGKDTAARHIMVEFPNTRHRKFAGPMKASLRAFFGLSDALWKELELGPSGPLKLQPMRELFDRSWVETLIWYSEKIMKPRFGPDVFGRLMVADMAQPTPAPLTVISDSGFADEALCVVDAYGPANCHVFQLSRPGNTFEGDSRDYLKATDLPAGVTFHAIENKWEAAMFRRQILIRTNKILGLQRTYE